MELIINHQPRHFNSKELSVQALLDLTFPNKQNGIAIAVNNAVIPKSKWPATPVSEKDNILIIQAAQGG